MYFGNIKARAEFKVYHSTERDRKLGNMFHAWCNYAHNIMKYLFEERKAILKYQVIARDKSTS